MGTYRLDFIYYLFYNIILLQCSCVSCVISLGLRKDLLQLSHFFSRVPKSLSPLQKTKILKPNLTWVKLSTQNKHFIRKLWNPESRIKISNVRWQESLKTIENSGIDYESDVGVFITQYNIEVLKSKTLYTKEKKLIEMQKLYWLRWSQRDRILQQVIIIDEQRQFMRRTVMSNNERVEEENKVRALSIKPIELYNDEDSIMRRYEDMAEEFFGAIKRNYADLRKNMFRRFFKYVLFYRFKYEGKRMNGPKADDFIVYFHKYLEDQHKAVLNANWSLIIQNEMIIEEMVLNPDWSKLPEMTMSQHKKERYPKMKNVLVKRALKYFKDKRNKDSIKLELRELKDIYRNKELRRAEFMSRKLIPDEDLVLMEPTLLIPSYEAENVISIPPHFMDKDVHLEIEKVNKVFVPLTRKVEMQMKDFGLPSKEELELSELDYPTLCSQLFLKKIYKPENEKFCDNNMFYKKKGKKWVKRNINDVIGILRELKTEKRRNYRV